MADLSGLGDLVISIGGDISPLEDALGEIPGVAQNAATEIQAAFDALPSAEGTAGLNALSSGLQEAGDQASVASEEFNALEDSVKAIDESAQSEGFGQLADGLNEAGDAANELESDVEGAGEAVKEAADEGEEATEKFKEWIETAAEIAGITVSIEALVETLSEAVAGFEAVQRAQISLTALTGSAEEADQTIEQLKTLAVGDALSFPALLTAQQRMQAFGISAEQTPALLMAAANAAAVMGTSVDQAANSIDRIGVSGAASARILTQLGLSTHDLATAMGVTDDAATKAFKDLDQSDRLNVLVTALQKFQGVAADVASTLTGQWQSFKTSLELALEGIGESIATLLTGAVQQAQTSVVPGLQAIAQGFKDLGEIIGPIIGGAIQSLIQSFGDLATVIGSTMSVIAQAITQSNSFNISAKSIVSTIGDVTPWGLFSNSIHEAATDIQLLNASAQIAAQSALDMQTKFTSVTASLKDFIDKENETDDSLLQVRTQFDNLKQAVSDAQDKLNLVQQAYDQGYASAGQLEQATNALNSAQKALNGTLDTSHSTIASVAADYDNLKTALATAQANLTVVATAYAQGVASLTQYTDALAKVKSAQDALNGSMAQTPAQQVAEEFAKLQQNLVDAQSHLQAVSDALKNGQATMGMYQSAVSAVNSAQQALSGTIQASTTAVSSSQAKIIDVAQALAQQATATTAVSTATSNFVGPVQATGDAIQVFAGNSQNAAAAINQMQLGIQVLNGSVPTLGSAFDATKVTIIGLDNAFKQTAADLQNYINGTTQAIAANSDLEQSIEDVTAAAEAQDQAFQDTLDAMDALSASANVTGFGQGGGGTAQLPAGAQISNITPGPMGGASADTGFHTLDPWQATLNALQFAAQANALAGQGQQTAATSLTTAADTLQTAADSTDAAAKAALIGANTTTQAAQDLITANDAISASSLNAATLSANAIVGAGQILANAATEASTSLTEAASSVLTASSVVTQAATAAAAAVGATVSASTFTLNQPVIAPTTTATGPAGATTFTPFGQTPWTPGFESTVGNTGPQVNVTLNAGSVVGSNGMNELSQVLMNQLLSTLSSMGLRMVRT